MFSCKLSSIWQSARAVARGPLSRLALTAALASISGCAGLLPNEHQTTQTPWHSYAEAQAMFARIVPGATSLQELKALGIDPDKTPNIAILDHADLLRRLVPTSSFDVRLLDPGLQGCVLAPGACFAYEIEQTYLDRQRFGNFWLDFLHFKRTVDVSGWQFDAIVVIKNDKAIYKLWSGTPSIHRLEQERSPLGPLQGMGSSLFAK